MFHRSDLLGHDNVVHKKIGLFECFECNLSFNENSQLFRHFVNVHQNKTEQPNPKDTSSKDENKEIVTKEIVTKKALKCRKCVNVFTGKKALLRHYKVAHQTTDIWICDICDIVFNEENFFERHNRVHDTNRPHKCPTCAFGCQFHQHFTSSFFI